MVHTSSLSLPKATGVPAGLARRPLTRASRTAALVAVALAAFLLTNAPAHAAGEPQDWGIPNGWFFTQTGSNLEYQGFRVTDNHDVPFWTFFQENGGVSQFGYPISRRWMSGPFTLQAFQRAILQWQPGRGMFFLNIYDNLSRDGFDDWLNTVKNIPPPQAFPEDAGQPFSVIKENHLRLLDQNLAIKEKWFENPRWLSFYGLPVAYEDRGDVKVLRGQRASFQHWIINTSFARAGDVTISLAGDHYKQAGFIPEQAAKVSLDAEAIQTGFGDAVVEINFDAGLAQIVASHGGQSNFIVRLHGADSEVLLVNEIGPYYGITATGVAGGRYLLEVQADGAWILGFRDPQYRSAATPPFLTGAQGDWVSFPVRLTPGAYTVEGAHAGLSNFIVWVHYADGRRHELLFNEIGVVGATRVLRVDTEADYVFVVAASDLWVLDLERA